MAIRYDKKINQEINRTIRNFNQKISRLEKEERNLILPEKITKKALKESVYTRSELKRKLSELQRYSKRGIEETITTSGGVDISKYEYINLRRESTRLKRNLSREIKAMETIKPKVFGKEQARTFAQMGDQAYLNLKAKREALEKNIERVDKEVFERYKKLVTKIGKSTAYQNTIFKDSYMDMLNKLGYFYNYPQEKLEEIKNKVTTLSPKDFLKLFQNEKAIKAILDYYPTITGSIKSINPDDFKEDVFNLYDALYENIDEIIDEYA